MGLNRRQLMLGAAASALAGLAHAAGEKKHEWAKKPDVPTDFNPEEFFVELQEKGTGIHFPAAKGNPTAFMVFDTQCPWCVWEFKELKPFMDKVNFVWFPVAVLSKWSERQAAVILADKDPVAKFMEHEAHFKDADFRGLDVRGKEIPEDMVDAVWTNSKIYRRAGGRTVPFGVIRLNDGRYVPIAEQKTDAFAKLIGLK